MQAEFYAAETLDDDTYSKNGSGTKSDSYYRDVQLNLRPKGSNFICEVQLTLTGISILKKSEQSIYTLARMASGKELTDTFVFSERHEFSSPDALPAGEETISSALPCDDDAGEFAEPLYPTSVKLDDAYVCHVKDARSSMSPDPQPQQTAEDEELVESGRRRLEPSRGVFGFCSCEALPCAAPARVAIPTEA